MSDPRSLPQSVLYDTLFGDSGVAAALSSSALVQRMLDVEVALARAEADAGVIPAAAVPPIAAAARADLMDLRRLAADAAASGNLVIPLVRQLTALVAERDEDAAGVVHWGATSQDIIDTALVLQLRDGVPHVLRHLDAAASSAASHAKRFIATPMAGRTWLQQATPVSFGLKAAGWLDALMRERRMLAAALDAASVLQFGGASGTLASLGDAGLRVSEALGARLGLEVPAVPWHTSRGRLASLGCALGVTAGVLGKIARDLALLSQTEVGEAMEAPAEGRGGSSTMPHKRNPISASIALAAATRTPGLVAALLGSMGQEHERGLGGWQAEWVVLPELVQATGGAARAIASALEHLVVNEERMRENLQAGHGLPLAEAISMALAGHVGKARAHALLERAVHEAVAQDRPLADIVSAMPEVTEWISPAEIRRRLMPENYLGAAQTFVTRALEKYETRDLIPGP